MRAFLKTWPGWHQYSGSFWLHGVKSVSAPAVPSNRPDSREPICLSSVQNSIASTAVYRLCDDVSAFAVSARRASIRCNYRKHLWRVLIEEYPFPLKLPNIFSDV